MDQKRKTKKKIPRPVALADTFFNRNLLLVDPVELREELFSTRSKEEYWGLLENLLWALEHDAELVLKETPGDSAIEVLRSVQIIRKEFRLRKVNGHYILDGIERGVEQTYDSKTVAKIVLETALLIMAAFRGDFRGKYSDWMSRGKTALEGTRKKRSDNLNRVIIKELRRQPTQSAKQILASLERVIEERGVTDKSVVYEITEKNEVGWYDQRGVAKGTKFHAFEKRVSKLKKQLLAK